MGGDVVLGCKDGVGTHKRGRMGRRRSEEGGYEGPFVKYGCELHVLVKFDVRDGSQERRKRKMYLSRGFRANDDGLILAL